MIRTFDATTHPGVGVSEMVRLSQEVNAISINPSSPVQWGEFSHSQAKLPDKSIMRRFCLPWRQK